MFLNHVLVKIQICLNNSETLQVHYMCKLMVIHIEVKVITFWFLWSQKCDNPRPLAKSCITCKDLFEFGDGLWVTWVLCFADRQRGSHVWCQACQVV